MGHPRLTQQEWESFDRQKQALIDRGLYKTAMREALDANPPTRWHVYLLQQSIYSCCNLHADMSGCDCMEKALSVPCHKCKDGWIFTCMADEDGEYSRTSESRCPDCCERCNGRGEVRDGHDYNRTWEKCELCEGTGRQKAKAGKTFKTKRNTVDGLDIDQSPTPVEERRRNGLVEITHRGQSATVTASGQIIPVKEWKLGSKETKLNPWPQDKILEFVTTNFKGMVHKQELLKYTMSCIPSCSDVLAEMEDMLEKGLLVELFYLLPGNNRTSSLIFLGGTEMRTWKTDKPREKVLEVERE